MPIYSAHFVVEVENQWHEPGSRVIRRKTVEYFVATQLFAAPDVETAYSRANSWIDGFGDANHDGPGDLTEYRGIGLHDLEEVVFFEASSPELNDAYGVDVGRIRFGETKPQVRSRSELSVFAVMTPNTSLERTRGR